MLPACNKGPGMTSGFPDPCSTPKGPVVTPDPYPNVGLLAQAVKFCRSVKICMIYALNMGSKITMTSGMESGVAHPTLKAVGRFLFGNLFVFIEKKPAINMLCPASGNNMNNALGVVAVGSALTVFFCYDAANGEAEDPVGSPPARDPFARNLDMEALEELADVTNGSAGVEFAVLENAVGYLKIPLFSSHVATEVFARLRRANSGKLRTLIIDLRGNRGGDFEGFRQLAEDFLERGTTLCLQTDGDGDLSPIRARHDASYRLPLLLLTDGASASAAELFAGCLQFHGRARVVGETSRGKGVAQTVVALPNGGGVLATTAASFALPDGRPIQGVGVIPDIEVVAANGSGDAVLERAISLAADEEWSP